jgi:hypothetical protein
MSKINQSNMLEEKSTTFFEQGGVVTPFNTVDAYY